MQNRLRCPISDLPNEILIHIFNHIFLADLRRIDNVIPPLRLVCRHWATLIVETPELWARIHTTSPPAFNKQAVNLSRNVPIDVLLNSVWRDIFIPDLPSHIHRARTIRIQSWSPSYAKWALGIGEKPFLQELTVDGPPYDPRALLEIAPNGTLPDGLQSISLRGASLLNWETPFPSLLRKLELSNTRPTSPSLSDVFNILKTCLGLAELGLIEMPGIALDCPPLWEPIHLANLRTLRLSLESQPLFLILTSIMASDLEHTRLDYTVWPIISPGDGAATPRSHEEQLRNCVIPILRARSDYLLECSLRRDEYKCVFTYAARGTGRSTFAEVTVEYGASLEAFAQAHHLLYFIVREARENFNGISLQIVGDLPLSLLDEIHTTLVAPRDLRLPPITELRIDVTGETLKTYLASLCADNPVVLPDLQTVDLMKGYMTEAELLHLARERVCCRVPNPAGSQYVTPVTELRFGGFMIQHATHEELIALLKKDTVPVYQCMECREGSRWEEYIHEVSEFGRSFETQ